MAKCRELLNQGSFQMLSGRNNVIAERKKFVDDKIYLLTKVTS